MFIQFFVALLVVAVALASDPVPVALYYEALCPGRSPHMTDGSPSKKKIIIILIFQGCQQFITTSLKSVMNDPAWSSIIALKMVPYVSTDA